MNRVQAPSPDAQPAVEEHPDVVLIDDLANLGIVDRSKLPTDDRVHALASHFIKHTLPAFPIFNVKSLDRLVQKVCLGNDNIEQWEICAVYSA